MVGDLQERPAQERRFGAQVFSEGAGRHHEDEQHEGCEQQEPEAVSPDLARTARRDLVSPTGPAPHSRPADQDEQGPANENHRHDPDRMVLVQHVASGLDACGEDLCVEQRTDAHSHPAGDRSPPRCTEGAIVRRRDLVGFRHARPLFRTWLD